MHSLKAAAHAVGMHPRTLRRWIADGKVSATKGRGSNGEAWYLDRDQLDHLRTIAARDVEPLIAGPEQPQRLEQPTAQLAATASAPALDLAGLVAAIAAAVAAERAAIVEQTAQQLAAQRQTHADSAAAMRQQLDAALESYRAQLDAERQAHAAIVAAMRAQLDAERRRADDAADATAHARAMLEDARGLVAAQAATIAAMQQRATATATRSTQPLDRGALRSIAGGV